jgi:hypothetical protein
MADKKWMQSAVKKPGALTKTAKSKGMSISELCSGKNLSGKTAKRCSLAKTFAKFRPK